MDLVSQNTTSLPVITSQNVEAPQVIDVPEAEVIVKRILSLHHEKRVRQHIKFLYLRSIPCLILLGYFLTEILLTGREGDKVLLLIGFFIANIAAFAVGYGGSRLTRKLFGLIDVAAILVLRHVYLFEILIDPNATFVSLLAVVMIGYVYFGDASVSLTIGVFSFLSTVATVLLGGPCPTDCNGIMTLTISHVRFVTTALMLSYVLVMAYMSYRLAIRVQHLRTLPALEVIQAILRQKGN